MKLNFLICSYKLNLQISLIQQSPPLLLQVLYLIKGNGYAPSIPYMKDKELKANIKDILMLAKAGMLVGDI